MTPNPGPVAPPGRGRGARREPKGDEQDEQASDDDLDVRRDVGRRLHGVARQPRRDDRAARHQARPGSRALGSRVDGQRLHPDLCRAAADRRRPGRPLRPQAHVPGRPRDLHAGLGFRRGGAQHRRPDRGARPAGRGRRHRHAADPDDPLGGRAAGPPRPGPGHLERHRRPGRGFGAGHRWRHRRRLLLAVHLLGERADRPGPVAGGVLPPERDRRAPTARSTCPDWPWSAPACSVSSGAWCAATPTAGRASACCRP